jgi:hypothetical protein
MTLAGALHSWLLQERHEVIEIAYADRVTGM